MIRRSDGSITRTGVDRGALDAALGLGVACAGWCPKGRLAEDGPIPARYPLTETKSAATHERTALNVRDSDATLILATGPGGQEALEGGTLYTLELAEKEGKPLLTADPGGPAAVTAAARWLTENNVRILNVAGPRESNSPGIQVAAKTFIRALIEATRTPS